MKEGRKFLKGFLLGMAVMAVCGYIGYSITTQVAFDKARVRTIPQAAEAVETETQESSILSLDEDKVEEKITEIEKVVNQYFLDEIDQEEVENYLYKGLIAGLDDPYADYYSKEELEKLNESTSGEYVGVGATLSQDRQTGLITIVKCFEGTPSAEAGLLPGDIIYRVNDTEVSGMELTQVVKLIKTEPGETVKLSVAREGETDYLDFDVERRAVEIPTVTYEMLDGKIGYLVVSEFDTITEQQFKEALDALNEQGMEKLIIDLRNNLGGVLTTVCNMLQQILPEGLIVYTEDKDGNRTEYTCDGSNEFDKPLVVLTNGYSASASEIFAGAVKDYGIGTLVGTTTYGKGIVQRIVELEDGSAVKLTIAKYYTPKGNDIHEVGVEPDVEIDLTDELKKQTTLEQSEDIQLRKAIEVVNGENQGE